MFWGAYKHFRDVSFPLQCKAAGSGLLVFLFWMVWFGLKNWLWGPCLALPCAQGWGWGGRRASGSLCWASMGAVCEVPGDGRGLRVGGCSAGEPAEMAEADREHPTMRLGDEWLGWPKRQRAVIATTVFAKRLWETHVLPDLSADYFFQNKRHYFCTVNLHFSALPPSLSLSLSHTHTFFFCLGGF